MGLFNKKKKQTELTPDMAGYRPPKDWWPDLTAYKKALLLHNISLDDIKTLLVEYASITNDAKKVICEFNYLLLPGSDGWVYLEFPDAKDVPHYRNFWSYQNLMIWLSQKSDREFCFAVPASPAFPLFVSMRDVKNPCGDSTMGIYGGRDFYFTVPGEVLEWGPVPETGFDYAGSIKSLFGFDLQLLSGEENRIWEKTVVTFSFPEE